MARDNVALLWRLSVIPENCNRLSKPQSNCYYCLLLRCKDHNWCKDHTVFCQCNSMEASKYMWTAVSRQFNRFSVVQRSGNQPLSNCENIAWTDFSRHSWTGSLVIREQTGSADGRIFIITPLKRVALQVNKPSRSGGINPGPSRGDSRPEQTLGVAI